jgi:hypothetical protein
MQVASSNLQSIRYSEKKEELTVTFRSGGIYRYFDVEPETIAELKFADSKGQYFFTRIRDNYRYEIVRASRKGFSHARNTSKTSVRGGYIGNTEHSPENR